MLLKPWHPTEHTVSLQCEILRRVKQYRSRGAAFRNGCHCKAYCSHEDGQLRLWKYPHFYRRVQETIWSSWYCLQQCRSHGLGCSDDKGWLWHSDSDESREPLLDDCSPLAFAKGNSWEVWRCNSHPSVLWCFWKGWTHRRCCKSQQSSSSSWTDAVLSPVCSWWFYRTLGSLWSEQVGQRHCLLRSWIVEWKMHPACEGGAEPMGPHEGRILQGAIPRAQTAKHLDWVGCGSTSPGESDSGTHHCPWRPKPHVIVNLAMLLFCGFGVSLFFLGVKPHGWEFPSKKVCRDGSIAEVSL